MNLTMLGCCGIKEMAGIAGHAPQEVIRFLCVGKSGLRDETKQPPNDPKHPYDLYAWQNRWNGRFILFSEAGGNPSYGKKLAAYILKHKLGTVVEVPAARNPNSSNMVRPYIWTIDDAGLTKWADKHCEWRNKTPTTPDTVTINASNV